MRLRPISVVALLTALIAVLTVPAFADANTTLSVTKSGSGRGTVTSDVPGIDCGATCSFDYGSSTVVTLTAAPAAGSAFLGWSGACSGTGACQVTTDAAPTADAAFGLSYRPDAWIKLCGLSTGCTLRSGPHPWKGNDVYNSTGDKQTIRLKMEEGEGVRYWMTFENDGALDDTIVVDGCKGSPRFTVNVVTLGFTKGPAAGTPTITKKFKNGTATFPLGPSSTTGDKAEITLNIIATTTQFGVSYRCPIVISSQNDPTVQDKLVTEMTTN